MNGQSEDLAADVAAAIDDALARRLAEHARQRDAQKASRAQRAIRRAAGLRARHAAKLARTQGSRSNPWTSPQPSDLSNRPHRTGSE